MFLRKVTVILLPLLGLAALLQLRGLLPETSFWGHAALGLGCGACLGLLPRLAGGRARAPFSRQLLVPALLLLALIVTQSFAVRGVHTLLPAFLAAPDSVQLAAEAVLCGALLASGWRR